MVTTRSSNKRGTPVDSTTEDQGEAKRLRVETIDGQRAGASANSSGAAAAPTAIAAINEVDKNDDMGGGEGPGQGPPAGVVVPVATNDTGVVNGASGDGGGIAAPGLGDEMQRATAGLCLLRQESPGNVTSLWNRVFWKRGAFTRVRLVGEAAAAAAAWAAAETKAAAEAAAAEAGTVRAMMSTGASAAMGAGGQQGIVHVDGDADADDDGGVEVVETPDVSNEFEAFQQEQRAMWAECAEQVRRDRAAFLASVEGPGAAAHVKLMEDMGAAGASEEEALAAKEALDSRIQEWQQEQFVAACGGRTFAEGVRGASGTEGEEAPSAAGVGTGTGGVGPWGRLFGTPIGGIGSTNGASSSGSTDGELSDMSPQKVVQPSPSPSSDDHAGQGRGKGKGKKRRRDDDDEEEEEEEEDDGSEGNGAKRARQ